MNLINFQKCRAMTNVLADCSQCGAVNQIKAQKTGDDHFIKWTDSTLGQIVIIAQERERRNQELPLVKRRHPSSTPRRGEQKKKSASPIHKKRRGKPHKKNGMRIGQLYPLPPPPSAVTRIYGPNTSSSRPICQTRRRGSIFKTFSLPAVFSS